MPEKYILKVSELTRKVKFILESELNTVWLTGEISNFVAAGSGHWYLTLKDDKAQVKCAMFKGNNVRVRIRPQNGAQVLVRARVSLYEPRGDFQLILEQMEDAGEGLLRQAYEQLKNKLYQQGYFEQQHKKAIPDNIQSIGVVTSPTGAAIKDILAVLKRRSPNSQVIVYPALVQGDDAKHDIAQAIEVANLRQECDVLLVGRGGGSLEDLWAFNEEIVVNAIFNSHIPIISAVGHEIDTTLTDYVADLRAPTPSAAAELVSRDEQEIGQKVTLLEQQLFRLWRQKQTTVSKELSVLQHRLTRVHPQTNIETQLQKADDLQLRLQNAMLRSLKNLNTQPQQLSKRLSAFPLLEKVQSYNKQRQDLTSRLVFQNKIALEQKGLAFGSLVEQLHLVSPLATIARGYSVVRADNKIVKSVEQLTQGENIDIQLKDGKASATINSITSKN